MNCKTRLVSITVLLISIIMSMTIFIFLLYLQTELINIHLHFFRDLSCLISYDFIHLIQNANEKDLKDFAERLFLTSSSIDYLQLFDSEGSLLLSFPSNSIFYKDIWDLRISFLDQSYHIPFFYLTPLSDATYLRNSITNCLIPLVSRQKLLGFLQLGLSFNFSIVNISSFSQIISSFVFVIVWFLFILGVSFSFFIISEPVSEMLQAIHKISLGNFNQKINTFTGGLIGHLIVSFNEMSERLLSYEKNNIIQLTSEKIIVESLVSTITDGAILLDTELRILLLNQIAVKLFHWSNQDLIGSTISSRLPIHVNEALLPMLNNMIKSNCLENSTTVSQEIVINLNNESLKSFRFLLSTISSNKDQYFNGVVIIIQDITRENQLDEAKNQFVSNVSHELRTPLCNIGSFLETLIDYKYKLTDEQKDQFLEIAYAETQRLNTLVNDILDLSRLESECNYVLQPVPLSSTVLYIVQVSQIIAFNKQVSILLEVHPMIKKIFAHQNSLCQVLSNLISNSLKFTHKQGRIVVRIYPVCTKSYQNNLFDIVPEIVRLEIIDEGIGIHKMFQKQIFDRFMRVENNIHILKGTGLGLSIVQNILGKHNSRISVYSEVDIGTSFWFDLYVAN